MWKLELHPKFEKEFKKLDKQVQTRIAKELKNIITLEDPKILGKSLKGNLSEYWRYRFGDYRVIVLIEYNIMTILALKVGNRSNIYD